MKRGISPLIATVLLIGFTVALAAVIMTWGGGFVRDMTRSTEESTQSALKCTQLAFEINKVKCGANGGLTIENRGNVDIKSFTFRIYESSNAITSTTSSISLPKLGINTYTFNIPGSTTKVEAIANVLGDNNESIPCSSYTAKEIDPCKEISNNNQISASPNPCVIPQGKAICSSTISWSTIGFGSACIFLRETGQAFACNPSGSKSASWISEQGYTFDLHSSNDISSDILNSVFVKGVKGASS